MSATSIDQIISLAKRRGFFYPSSELYGGLANTWDFGHYGTLLKNNVRDLWWKKFVLERDDMVGIEASIFLNPKVWEASGHVAGFSDALVDCKSCRNRTRADHLIEDFFEKFFSHSRNRTEDVITNMQRLNPDFISASDDEQSIQAKVEGLPVESLSKIIKQQHIKCPKCGNENWTDARKFNLLFETHLGIIEGAKSKVYLRGEIAQGIFLNFANVLDVMKVRVPFGIAQQGKAFRNEITMGQAIHRTLEFDLMEFEYFVHPNEWEKHFENWREIMWKWASELGISQQNIRWREHEDFERSHYSKRTYDIEYHYPFGWKEMWGIAYRTDFDLSNHAKHSGKDLAYLDPKSGEKYRPHVVEPTFGLSRLCGILLFDAYHEEEVNGKVRTLLKLDPKVAPVKVAVFPLQKDEAIQKRARDVYTDLKKHFVSEFDDSGNIGKMYRRQDEIGTPWCVTIDYDTLKDDKVTVRDRDTMKQDRVGIGELVSYINQKLK